MRAARAHSAISKILISSSIELYDIFYFSSSLIAEQSHIEFDISWPKCDVLLIRITWALEVYGKGRWQCSLPQRFKGHLGERPMMPAKLSSFSFRSRAGTPVRVRCRRYGNVKKVDNNYQMKSSSALRHSSDKIAHLILESRYKLFPFLFLALSCYCYYIPSFKTAEELSTFSQCQHLIRAARSFVQNYMRWRYIAIARPLRNNRCIAARKVGDMTILRIAFQIACNYHSILPTTDPSLTFWWWSKAVWDTNMC